MISGRGRNGEGGCWAAWGEWGVCVWENVSQDIVPISTNTQGHLSLLMDCLTLLSIVSLRAGSKSLQPPLTRMSGDVGGYYTTAVTLVLLMITLKVVGIFYTCLLFSFSVALDI